MNAAAASAIGLNFYNADVPVKAQLRRRIPASTLPWAEAWLEAWGELCGGPIAARAEVIDRNPPKLVPLDRWGNDLGQVVHHPEAIATKRDLCESGFTGLRWQEEVRSRAERRSAAQLMHTTYSYMLNQSDTGMGCACGMTGGVATIVDRFANEHVREQFLPHLTTMRYDDLWDGAMFMTERSGGSDLSGTETTAIKDGQTWLLEGDKWFCSNVDARLILTLARPEGAGSGTKGLGLFLVPSHLEDGTRNSIRIRRIKDKLGTRSVPTGEVTYERAVAYQIGEAGIGINQMMEMVNFSRLGVAVMGAGIARRCTLEAALYASERFAFGKRLTSYPMVRQTLVDMQVDTEVSALMCLESAAIAGSLEFAEDRDELMRFLRILTPLAKIRSTRVGLRNAIEAVEILGGNGYIEDWPTARQLRDAQCHTIWEGTENINSLDVLRSMGKLATHEPLLARVNSALEKASSADLPLLEAARDEFVQGFATVSSAPEVHARQFANLAADLIGAALLVEEGAADERASLIASRFIRKTFGKTRFDADPSILDDSTFSSLAPPFGQ